MNCTRRAFEAEHKSPEEADDSNQQNESGSRITPEKATETETWVDDAERETGAEKKREELHPSNAKACTTKCLGYPCSSRHCPGKTGKTFAGPAAWERKKLDP